MLPAAAVKRGGEGGGNGVLWRVRATEYKVVNSYSRCHRLAKYKKKFDNGSRGEDSSVLVEDK